MEREVPCFQQPFESGNYWASGLGALLGLRLDDRKKQPLMDLVVV